MVVFRALSVDSATNILAGMFGMNGIALPDAVFSRLPGVVESLGVSGGLGNLVNLIPLAGWLLALAPIVFIAPNTLQMMDRVEPAISFAKEKTANFIRGRSITWRPSPAWAVVMAVVGWVAVSNIGGYSEFLYWQF